MGVHETRTDVPLPHGDAFGALLFDRDTVEPTDRRENQIVGFEPMATAVGMSTWQVPLPTFQQMLPQLAWCFVFEDFFHFWGTSPALSHAPEPR